MRPSRRDFLPLALGALALPQVGWAQSAGAKRVGALMAVAEDDPDAKARADAMRAGLAAGGWPDKSLQIDFRWSPGEVETTRRFASELVNLKPDVLVANASPATAELMKLTRTIPIVFALVADPVGSGFITSIAKPGGNVTGYVNFEASLVTKWVQLLQEIDPAVSRAMMMFNPDTAPGGGAFFLDPFTMAAQSARIATEAGIVRSDAEIASVIAAFAAKGPHGALVAAPDVYASAHRSAVIAAVSQAKLPAIYPYRYYAAEGGLMSYGIDTTDVFRLAGGYAARILSGAKPADLPVQAPSRYEFVINSRTAAAQGIQIPASMFTRADDVIG